MESARAWMILILICGGLEMTIKKALIECLGLVALLFPVGFFEQ